MNRARRCLTSVIEPTLMRQRRIPYIDKECWDDVNFCHFSFRFWAVIDDALRTVALEKKVEVRLLCSNWSHTAGDMLNYLHSLAALQGVMQGASIQVVSRRGS